MIIHRGNTKENAILLEGNTLMSQKHEAITKILNEIFGPKDGDWMINCTYHRKDMQNNNYILVQLEDKDKDVHTMFFKLNSSKVFYD